MLLGALLVLAPARSGANGQFTTPLYPSLTQELWLVGNGPEDLFSGIAFDRAGNVWLSDGTTPTLRHYGGGPLPESQAHGSKTVHLVDKTSPNPGHGITLIRDMVNDRTDKGVMYGLTPQGVVKFSTDDGSWLAGPYLPPGAAAGYLAIAVSPADGTLYFEAKRTTTNAIGIFRCGPNLTGGQLVYPQDTDLDIIHEADGMVFEPTGQYLFVALDGDQAIRVLQPSAPPASMVVQTFSTVGPGHPANNPDGLAFHDCGDPFLVSSDNSGALSRYVFPPGDYSAPPTIGYLATGGFRGDFVKVGGDKLYAIQTHQLANEPYGLIHGTRYDDGTVSTSSSVVRVGPCFQASTADSACAAAPTNMVAWWPLDDGAPLLAREALQGKYNGTQIPAFPPSGFVAGKVNGAYYFGTDNRYVSAGHEVGKFSGDFTVDAWVKLDPGRSTCGVVVDKESGNATTNMLGFQLSVNNTNNVVCVVGLGGKPDLAGHPTTPTRLLGPVLTPSVWHHLAFSGQQIHQFVPGSGWTTRYLLRLWVNGIFEANTQTPQTVGLLSVVNDGDLRIGRGSENQGPCPFGGAIDEVELFDRMLFNDEVLGLAERPKCKCNVQVCDPIQFGPNDHTRPAKIRICNQGPSTSIPWTITKLPAQAAPCSKDCTPIDISPSSGSVFVPQGTCAVVDITITMPPNTVGYLPDDKTGACFMLSSSSCSPTGNAIGHIFGPTIIDSVTQCVTDPVCFKRIVRPGEIQADWTIYNTSASSAALRWFAFETPPLGSHSSPSLSLDGLPLGMPTAPQFVTVPGNGSVQVGVTARPYLAVTQEPTHLQLVVGAVADSEPAIVSDLGVNSDESCGGQSASWMVVPTDSLEPARRSAGTMITDVANGRLVLFGGTDGVSSFDDVWTAAIGTSTVWTPLAVAGTPPAARSGHAAIYDPLRQRMVVFGGRNGSDLNDAWELSLGMGSETWTPLGPLGSPPSPRSGVASIYDPNGDRMIVFGGSSMTNDLHALNLGGSTSWTPLSASGTAPDARQGASAVYDPQGHRMLVFGGAGTLADQNDLWQLSLSGAPAWSNVGVSAPLPAARHDAFAVLDTVSHTLTIFGGADGAGLRSDMWSLDLAGPSQWVDSAPLGVAGPGARSGAMGPAASIAGRSYLFGGADSSATAIGLWSLPSARICVPSTTVAGVAPPVVAGGSRFSLAPNPFRGATNIAFSLAERAPVVVGVFDVAGRKVRKMDLGMLGPGPAIIHWDGKDDDGVSLHAGFYFVRARIGTQSVVRRAVMLR